jgi:hypothetical protein
MPCFPQKEVRVQLFFNVTHMPTDDGLIDVQPQLSAATIRLFGRNDEVAEAAKSIAAPSLRRRF